MILADKIIQLRKKAGWSQEELADKMNVSRQSVSKWEGALSMPDLDKIIKLGNIFGVSIDYLLKEELEEEEYVSDSMDDDESCHVHRVSMEEANEFLRIKAYTAKRIALATFLCIISPISLIILGTFTEMDAVSNSRIWMNENAAGVIGMIVLILLVLPAIMLFISSGMKTSQFEYLEKEIIELEYGVKGMVSDRKKAYADTYTRSTIIGTSLCVISVIPIFLTLMIAENSVLLGIMVGVMLLTIAAGVVLFIISGINWESYKKLLQEGEYSRKEKQWKISTKAGAIASVYWLMITAIYLLVSFTQNNWGTSWIIWPVAGILWAAIATVIKLVAGQGISK